MILEHQTSWTPVQLVQAVKYLRARQNYPCDIEVSPQPPNLNQPPTVIQKAVISGYDTERGLPFRREIARAYIQIKSSPETTLVATMPDEYQKFFQPVWNDLLELIRADYSAKFALPPLPCSFKAAEAETLAYLKSRRPAVSFQPTEQNAGIFKTYALAHHALGRFGEITIQYRSDESTLLDCKVDLAITQIALSPVVSGEPQAKTLPGRNLLSLRRGTADKRRARELTQLDEYLAQTAMEHQEMATRQVESFAYAFFDEYRDHLKRTFPPRSPEPIPKDAPPDRAGSKRKGKGGRPRNADDEWARVQVHTLGRSKPEVLREWKKRIGERAHSLADVEDSFDKVVGKKPNEGE